jgi:hypothetical protein
MDLKEVVTSGNCNTAELGTRDMGFCLGRISVLEMHGLCGHSEDHQPFNRPFYLRPWRLVVTLYPLNILFLDSIRSTYGIRLALSLPAHG